MDKLSEFLRDAARKDYRMGEWDCGLWLADWYIAATGSPDPAAHLRGQPYTNAELAQQMRRTLRALGLARTKSPMRGDVGLVSAQRGHLVGAIFTGQWWCMLTNDRGIGATTPEHLRLISAWRMVHASTTAPGFMP